MANCIHLTSYPSQRDGQTCKMRWLESGGYLVAVMGLGLGSARVEVPTARCVGIALREVRRCPQHPQAQDRLQRGIGRHGCGHLVANAANTLPIGISELHTGNCIYIYIYIYTYTLAQVTRRQRTDNTEPQTIIHISLSLYIYIYICIYTYTYINIIYIYIYIYYSGSCQQRGPGRAEESLRPEYLIIIITIIIIHLIA